MSVNVTPPRHDTVIHKLMAHNYVGRSYHYNNRNYNQLLRAQLGPATAERHAIFQPDHKWQGRVSKGRRRALRAVVRSIRRTERQQFRMEIAEWL